ncbi:MAG: beta-propeller fold lactonase family protein [Planctomycetes bacterium]|nr:beta-propeller fold lactonase family protein [Planctomycetota bacterium]
MHVATNRSLRQSLAIGLALACATACGGGGGATGGSGSQFTLLEVSNGFGKLLPHQIAVPDAQGQPSNAFVEITRIEHLIENATAVNLIRRPTEWPVGAVLPNSLAGNHYLFARFSQPIDPLSVLSRDSSEDPGTIGAGIQVYTLITNSGVVTPVSGRAFVGGRTFGPALSTTAGQYLLETWVRPNAAGTGIEAVPLGTGTLGHGFPGTEAGAGFAGDSVLVGADTFVFVVDADNDLETHETFPSGQILMKIGTQVFSARGRRLEQTAVASSTVGPDTFEPAVQVEVGTGNPMIVPGNGQADIDPRTNVVVQFTEPIQPVTLGDLDDGTPPGLSAAIRLSFGPDAARVQVPFSVRPISVFDLTRFELSPLYDFPGSGPLIAGVACDNIFGTVEVRFSSAQFDDLVGRVNSLDPSTFFSTREGPGIVNAPVTPDALYIGRAGSVQGISVIDLNGFGAGTGSPLYDQARPIQRGGSNYPNNPNVALQGTLLVPPLTRGDCTFNGGSTGPMTLVTDSSLQDLVASAPLLESVADMAIGHALDNTFNNESPFGCQAGGGNLCAQSGLKNVSIISGGPNTVASANIANIAPLKTDSGVENLASWAPHPNPPPLIFPPLCLSPLINGQEPTAIDSTYPLTPVTALNVFGPPFPPRSGPQLRNLLVPGAFPFGDVANNRPPQNALTSEQNSFFEGPALPQPTLGLCSPFMIRQQIGQFLYVVDRSASEIVVLNSNRFTVLDRIRLLDPTSLAMSPSLDFLAVTNEGADQVSFIDIDPSSATFHQVIKTTTVGAGPTGIAWEAGNEDIFVCNQGEDTVSVISGFTLEVRKVLRNQIARPVDVALTPRQGAFGFLRGVYFGYILNQNGNVAFFESGPDGVNGFGFDDVIGSLPFRFERPKTIQTDPTNLNSGVWIVHENPLDELGIPTGLGGGALSTVGISAGFVGTIPLDPGPFSNPNIRQLEFKVFASLGQNDGLSGIPVDIAFDNMRNLSALTNFNSVFSPGTPISYNGKSLIKALGAFPIGASAPQYLFAAVPNEGVVEVFNMAGGSFRRVDTDPFEPGIQGIPAPNAAVLMDYFRQ